MKELIVKKKTHKENGSPHKIYFVYFQLDNIVIFMNYYNKDNSKSDFSHIS